MLLLLALACKPEPPPPPPEPVNTCDLKLDGLDGKTFLLQEKVGKDWVGNKMARITFFKEGDKTKAKYTVKSLTDVYTYTCIPNGEELTCWEDNPDAADFCRSLIANGKECTADELAKLTGLTVEEAQKGKDTIDAEFKKLPAKEMEEMKTLFSSPANQLRGVLHVFVSSKNDKCGLTIKDFYQTMTFGQIRELENLVGTAYFTESAGKSYVFEHCTENKNLVALSAPDAKAKPGETKVDWSPGQSIPFRYVGDQEVKPADGCSYTMDTYADYELLAANTPVAVGADGKLDWSFSHSFISPQKGNVPYVVHMVRKKACGDKSETLPASCQGVVVK